MFYLAFRYNKCSGGMLHWNVAGMASHKGKLSLAREQIIRVSS